MDFSTFTNPQRESVCHLDGPLFIAAGAGSGKTFTLQQRIAYALLPESGPFLNSVDEVLAITFMEKAAAEIKARVRSVLRAEGMAEEALKVDAAWISTIHGMCSRILREHALEAGIDPAFTVLSEFDAQQLLRESIEEVLQAKSASREEDGACGALFAEYGVNAGGFNGVAVFDMLQDLLGKTASFADGLDAVDFGPEPPSPAAVAKRLLLAYEKAARYGETLVDPKKPKASLDAALTICSDGMKALQDYLEACDEDRGEERDGEQRDESYAKHDGLRGLGAVLMKLQVLRKDAFGRKNEVGTEMALLVSQELDFAYQSLNAALARPHTRTLLSLARQVDAVYQAKLDSLAALDNNGLLRRTRAMLIERPEIAATYQRRFKLVMVDEFQDTNQLQVDLIELVAGTGCLCTVGDAQQSIYRFNGADVSVFERQRSHVKAACAAGEPALEQRLDDNFRSHADVLAFVRRVCGQGRVFGEEFLDLQPSRKQQEGRFKGDGPRIEVQLVSYRGGKDASGALYAEAAGIAERFAALRDAGHTAGDMVVLLGKMSQVDVYAAALRDKGFECVLGGGSSFFELEEVQTVRNALVALANPADSEALFSALTSPMLSLSADDFLALGTKLTDDGVLRACKIDRSLLEADVQQEGISDSLRFALQLFARARARIKADKPSRVLMGMLLDSGWFARLEAQGAQGTSAAANILKAVRMVEDLEKKPGYGMARVVRDFCAMASELREAPASLSVSGQNAVRLMTIHKSKGLEFPIVAVASYEPWNQASNVFSMTAIDGVVHVALSAKQGKVEPAKNISNGFSADSEADPSAAADAVRYAYAIRNADWQREVAEAQRKFYVACTRASEYLLVSGVVEEKDPMTGEELEALFAAAEASDEGSDAFRAVFYPAAPMLDDVRAALMGSVNDFPQTEARLEYGGSVPARFARVRVSKDNPFLAEAFDAAAAKADAVTEVPVLSSRDQTACATVLAREGVFSYSGIAPHEDHLPLAERDDTTSATRGAEVRCVDEAAYFAIATAEESAGAQPSATDVGSAFHRVAQLAVGRFAEEGALMLPPANMVNAIARTYGIDGASRVRLDAALDRWFASKVARQVEGFARIRAEVPFMVAIPMGDAGNDAAGTSLRYLEGEIDLLAETSNGRRALVIDYKTGGSPQETPERLQDKHRLQATCYACALLDAGAYERVDFAFVRVEQSDSAEAEQPQVVRYSFSVQDLPILRHVIVEAYEKGARS